MRIRLFRSLWLSAILLAAASPASAEVWLFGGQYSIPLRWSGTAGVLVTMSGPMDRVQSVIGVDGQFGQGGVRVTAGLGRFTEGLYGIDARLTVARTSDRPRFAIARATHLGFDIGLTTPVFRATIGVARRLTGPPGPHLTVVTGSLGFVVAIPR